MKLMNIENNDIIEQAQKQFCEKVIEVDNTDLFLEDIEEGEIQIDGIEYPLYVGTHYVYEDHIVNNNKTRYKIPLSIIYVKDSAYEVIYDSHGKCYVAYEEEGIHFVLYEEFQNFLKPYVHKK